MPSQDHDPESSGCARSMLVLLASFGLGMAFLCAGGGVLAWWGLREINPTLDPLSGQQVVRTIADIQIPKELVPQFSIRMPDAGISGVYLGAEKSKEILILSQFKNPKNRGDFKLQLEQSAQKKTEDIEVTESQSREFKIRGKTAKFDFIKGKERGSKTDIRQVIGEFPGKEGTTDFIYFVPADKYDEARITGMIESIK